MKNLRGVAAVLLGLGALGSCQNRSSKIGGSPAEILAALRSRPASPLAAGVADSFQDVSGRLTPHFATSADRASARLTLPAHSTLSFHLEDAGSGAGVDVSLAAARESLAQALDGYVIYPNAHVSGATLLHRALPIGTEDFLSFEVRPAVPEIDYDIKLGGQVAGLRLVAGTLEMLDAGGAPRLRVAPPYVVGADGARTDATLAVDRCAVDRSPAAPWGRPVTAPGAMTCTLRVTWPDGAVAYPAVLDPRWTTTGSMTTTRQGHTATLLSTGNVLVVGGTSNGTTALATAELYNRTTGTWAATASLTGARTLHSATQLPTSSNTTTSGKVLIAGGLNGTTSQNTAQLYSPSAGTWVAAGNLNAARHGHTATLLVDGRVLATGGLNGTTTLNTAALYNPASGAGTWAAAAGTIPSALKSHAAAVLTTSNNQLSNKVLVFGGNNGTASVTGVYLFDPAQNAFSIQPSLPSAREGHTATVLANGNILVTGGKSGTTTLATTVLFNPSTGTGSWTSAGTMTAARQAHTATLIPSTIVSNGQVLVAGGSSGSATLSSAELWNGTTTWTATTAMAAPAQGHTATLLSNSAVLIAGGVNGTTTQSAARLYDASFALGCTSNSQCVTGFCVSGVCCDTACNGGCGACNLAGKVGTCSAVTSGTTCRAAAGTCDVAETCSGTSLTCPADGFLPATTTCRASAGVCDVAEKCTGTSAACPADGFLAATTVCRATAGVCDVAENCTGSAAACPTDAFLPATTTCRAAAGECDQAETCTGSAASCPADAKKASGTSCTDDGNACTKDQCDGSNVTCQHPAGNPGAVCRATAGECDLPETCTGSATTCPVDTKKPSGTSCTDDGNACTKDQCDGSNVTCQHPAGNPGVVCRAATGPCDVQEVCPGSSPTCPPDGKVANGTPCNDNNACTLTDTCQVGACVGANPVVCTASDQCHLVGTCNSSTGICSNPTAPVNTACSDGNVCNGAEVCNATGACQSPSLVSNGGFEVISTPSGGETVTGSPNNTDIYQFVPGPLTPGLFPTAPSPTALSGWTALLNGVEWSEPPDTGLNPSPDGGAWIDLAPFVFTDGGIQQSVPTNSGQKYQLSFFGGTSAFEGRSGTGIIDISLSGVPLASASVTGPSGASINWQLFSYQFTATSTSTLLEFRNSQDPVQHFGLVDGVRIVACDGSGACEGTPPTVDDGNPCTADACDPVAGVTHTPVTNGTACSDGNACTQADSCQAGVCVGSNPKACPASDSCHAAGTCDPTSGACSNPVSPNGTTCSDGNACTQTDACQAGVCVGGNPKTCAGGAGPCQLAATCDPTSGACTNPPVPNGTACNDGNGCTSSDSCQAGACVGAPVQCAAVDSCHAPGTCNAQTGTCSTPPLATAGCQQDAFDYDKAGRLIRDRGAQLVYDGYDQLRQVNPISDPPPITNLSVEQVGTLSGATQTFAQGLNAKGDVTGSSTVASGATDAFLVTASNPPVDLSVAAGLSGGYAVGSGINDADAVAGTFEVADGSFHAFRYSPTTGLQDLGNPGDLTVAYRINDQNQVVGYFSSGGVNHGYRYSDGPGFVEIGTLGGAGSTAWGIDAIGTVAASAQVADSPGTGFERFGHAAVYSDGVGLQDLNGLIDPTIGWTLITANKKAGDWVVGTGEIAHGKQRPYRMRLSTGAIDEIGTWEGDFSGSAVNSYAEAVGWGFVDSADHTQSAWFFSDQYGFVNLNDVIDPASGWNLQVTEDINDLGDVIGWGYHNGVVSGFRLRLPLRVSTGGTPTVAVAHTYGYDGLRTSTTNGPGTTGASVQFWFTQDYTEHGGVREHYVRIGDRIVAKVSYQPPPGGMMGAGLVRDPRHPPRDIGNLVAQLLIALLLAAGLAVSVAGFVGKKRRPGWVAATAGPVVLFFVASCEMLGTRRSSAETLWQRVETVYFHHGIAAGPVLTTNSDGTLREERRYEPFGQPIDADVGGSLGPVDFRREPQNSLGKLTDPVTGWSYHGARWMQPGTGRWTAPDSSTKAPTEKFENDLGSLNPYIYGGQSPSLFWDPDGLDKALFFYGLPSSPSTPIEMYDSVGNDKGQFTLTSKNRPNYEKGLKQELSRKTGINAKDIDVAPFTSNGDLQKQAASHSKGSYDVVGTVTHGFVDKKAIAPSATNSDKKSVSPEQLDQALQKVHGYKQVDLYGCDTDSNGFAAKLKSLEPDINVRGVSGQESFGISQDPKGNLGVTLSGDEHSVDLSKVNTVEDPLVGPGF